MLFYLSQHKLINRNQHGFLSRHGTCTQLLETINDWSIALRNHHAVDTVYFDFAKAFDSVSHTKLLHRFQVDNPRVRQSEGPIIRGFDNPRIRQFIMSI